MLATRSITLKQFLAGGTLIALVVSNAGSQTQVDLKSQARGVDFSSAASTKSFQSGTSLPGVCGVGQTFFKTNAQAGANFYGCSSSNTWTPQSGASSSAQYILDSADANVPNAQLGVAGPGVIISHSPFTISFNSSVLAGVYPSLAGPNIFTAGGRNTFQASATTEGIRIAGAAIPSAPLAGALFVTLSGQQGHFDGTNAQIHPTVAGSGTTAPAAPSSGNCAAWGSGFTQIDGGGPCAVRVSAPGSASASCAVGQYAASSTFFYVCVATNTWVRSALATW